MYLEISFFTHTYQLKPKKAASPTAWSTCRLGNEVLGKSDFLAYASPHSWAGPKLLVGVMLIVWFSSQLDTVSAGSMVQKALIHNCGVVSLLTCTFHITFHRLHTRTHQGQLLLGGRPGTKPQNV